ncbi:MAG: hypothetical protein KatS3mg031_2899 [Chitinophagales bacterium]|nr:MAG: hypothetical protein KatS3mg031_2899 [Chitinophagales bacterium]
MDEATLHAKTRGKEDEIIALANKLASAFFSEYSSLFAHQHGAPFEQLVHIYYQVLISKLCDYESATEDSSSS